VASNAVSFTVTVPAPSITSLNPASGLVGASVTIAGANFGATQGTSTVTFNGTAATATSWSATSIVVPVPTGATSGNVVVTVGGVASNGVTFTVLPAPTITSLTPVRGPVGTLVTITGTTFGATQGTSTVAFNGTVVEPSTGLSTRTLPSASDHVYTLPATVSNGQLSDSNTFTWTVRASAAPNDFDGDGKADLALFSPSTGGWSILQSGTNNTSSLTA